MSSKSHPVGVSPFAIAMMCGGLFVIQNHVGSNCVSVIGPAKDTVITAGSSGAPVGISFVQ